MILPTKYLPHERALISIGGDILKELEEPKTISALWDGVRDAYADRNANTALSFDWFVLALNFLYALSAINYLNGVIFRDKQR